MVVPARTARLGCRLAASALVLAVLCAPPTADAQSPRLEAAYVVLGPQGAVARAVLAQANECPAISIDGAQQPMSVRALPDAAFPVLVCERTIPAGASSASLENSPLPVPRPALKSIAAFGDTGCRLKSAKTAAKEGDTDDDDARGKFQDCNNAALWPFAQVAQSVADAKPDLVIHVGDYLYRESACPAGDAGCARSPYGDDWPTWKADFFAPAAPALRAAPWIVVRGNHEICRRAGAGLFSPARSDAGTDRRRHGPPPCIDLIPQFTVTCGSSPSSSSTQQCRRRLPVRSARYAAEFAAMKPKSGTWLLTHRPVWGFGPRRRTVNATLQEALANWSGKLPDGIALALAGHIHVVEVLELRRQAQPAIRARHRWHAARRQDQDQSHRRDDRRHGG